MESFYLLSYLKDNSLIDQSKYDNLRYELDKHLHYFGNHFKNPLETDGVKFRNILKKNIRLLLLLYAFLKNKESNAEKNVVLSNAYFSINKELEDLGYQVYHPGWRLGYNDHFLCDLELLLRFEKLSNKFQYLDFNELLKEDFIKELYKLEESLKHYFKRIRLKSLFVPNDVSFFENLSIQICKELGIPTFIFLHGLPGRYNHIDENRTDYLIVWGQKIKENYIKTGINPNKIFVSGHPYYKSINKQVLLCSHENILVLTKSMNGAHHSDGVILGNRANLLLYLFSIEKILKTNGIKSVRLRLHPSENSNWYLKFINIDFFKIDKDSLQDSIQNSTLIIGPTSSVFSRKFILWHQLFNL
jgi:hypothetical protein